MHDAQEESRGNTEQSRMKLDRLGPLFTAAWDLYEAHAATLIEIMLIPTIIALAGVIILSFGGPVSILGMVLYVIGYFFIIFAPVPLIYALHTKAGVDGSYKALLSAFWAAVWIALLSICAILGSFIMLIIPGIMLSILITFSFYTFVTESRHGIDALRASRRYVEGYWWAVFGRSLLLSVIIGVVVSSIEASFKNYFGSYSATAASLILGVFITPYSIAYSYSIFQNLKRLKPSLAEESSTEGTRFIFISAIVGVVAIAVILGLAIYFGTHAR